MNIFFWIISKAFQRCEIPCSTITNANSSSSCLWSESSYSSASASWHVFGSSTSFVFDKFKDLKFMKVANTFFVKRWRILCNRNGTSPNIRLRNIILTSSSWLEKPRFASNITVLGFSIHLIAFNEIKGTFQGQINITVSTQNEQN